MKRDIAVGTNAFFRRKVNKRSKLQGEKPNGYHAGFGLQFFRDKLYILSIQFSRTRGSARTLLYIM